MELFITQFRMVLDAMLLSVLLVLASVLQHVMVITVLFVPLGINVPIIVGRILNVLVVLVATVDLAVAILCAVAAV